mgnify:CR=1 FL=1
MCEKEWSRSSDYPELVRAGSEDSVSEGKPSDAKTNYFLSQLREELGEIRKALGSSDNKVSLALASMCNLERHIAAQEKKSQETVRSPETDQSVAQKISELRESLEDQSPQGDKSSSPKGEEYFLVAPIKGVDEGRLILGDQKILSASALKI